MVAGCPRTVSPPKEEVIKLGEKLVKWATEPTKEIRCRFCEWYTLPEIGMLHRQWDALCELPEFLPYYERARANLGKRYIDGTIHSSMAHRFMWHMVPESARQEKAKIDYQEEAKSKADIKTAQAISVLTVNYADTEEAN